jgi:hypothetical protein
MRHWGLDRSARPKLHKHIDDICVIHNRCNSLPTLLAPVPTSITNALLLRADQFQSGRHLPSIHIAL